MPEPTTSEAEGLRADDRRVRQGRRRVAQLAWQSTRIPDPA